MAGPQRRSASSVVWGFLGRCPACGEAPLFDGYLSVAPCCPACGLDYGFADAGDGPAIFIMLLVGFVVVGGALVVEMLYAPPYWLHALIWLPLAVILPLLLLRPAKGLLIGLQHHHKAAEARLDG